MLNISNVLWMEHRCIAIEKSVPPGVQRFIPLKTLYMAIRYIVVIDDCNEIMFFYNSSLGQCDLFAAMG